MSLSISPLAEHRKAAEGDRDDENVDQNEIERKQPRGARDILDRAVLDHCHVELARQQHGRATRQEDERAEADQSRRVIEQVGGEVALRETGRQTVEAVEHDEGHITADGQEGGKLDDGFERDRDHQPVLVLRRVRVPRPEGDRESREHHRHDEREIAIYRRVLRDRRAPGARQEYAERSRNRLELKRDVGDRADQRDERHERRDPLALAVARRHEVGDRGDVLRLGDLNDAGDECLAKADDEDRADVDGQEVEAGPGRQPDRAEEGPGGAIDGERQRIDRRARPALHDAAPGQVAPMRHGEEQAKIDQGRQNDCPSGDHATNSSIEKTRLARDAQERHAGPVEGRSGQPGQDAILPLRKSPR